MMEELQTARRTIRSIAVLVLGWALVVVGVIGLVLPVIPGGLLIAFGLLMLSTEHLWLRRALANLRARFPFLKRTLSWLRCGRENCAARVSNQ